MKGSLPDLAQGYMSGNVFEGRDDLTRDSYAALDSNRWLKPYGNYAYAGKLADWKAEGKSRTASTRKTLPTSMAPWKSAATNLER